MRAGASLPINHAAWQANHLTSVDLTALISKLTGLDR